LSHIQQLFFSLFFKDGGSNDSDAHSFMRQGPFQFYSEVNLQSLRVYVSMANLWCALGIEWLINLDQRWPSLRFTRKFWEFYLSTLFRGKKLSFELEVIK